MDPAQKDQPIQPNPAGVFTATPRPEGPPVAVSAEQSAAVEAGVEQPQIDQGPEFEPAQELDTEVANAGVVSHSGPAQPLASSDVQDHGESSSMHGPSFVPQNFHSAEEAKQTAERTPVNRGLAWQATEWFKGLLQGRKQPSEV